MDVSRRALLAGVGGVAGAGVLGTSVLGEVLGSEGADPTVLVAGSLLEVADRIPGAAVEAHGSATVRQLIRNDLRDPDGVALADPRLFAGISDEATLFATNSLVVTYAPDSPHADAIERDWASAVGDEDVSLGRTDPQSDPLGYRTVMALRLADGYGVDAAAVLDRAQIFLEVDLLNVVERGGVDAAFTYRNMAVQRDLPYVELPDRIDFSSPAEADTYATVSYDLPDQTVRGAPIRYGATATTDRGEEWIRSLVSGRDRLVEMGFSVPSTYPERGYRPEE